MRLKYILLSRADKKGSSTPKVLYLRVRDGRQHDWKVRTPIVVNPCLWDPEKEQLRIKPTMPTEEREMWGSVNIKLTDLKNFLAQKYARDFIACEITDDWLTDTLGQYFHKPKVISIKDVSEEFLHKHPLAESRKRQYMVLFRSLRRYEIYYAITHPRHRDFVLELNSITAKTIEDLWLYMRDESSIIEKYPKITKAIPTKKKTDIRSTNTLHGIFKRLRAFFNWCIDVGYMSTNPFHDYHMEGELYGTPVYITTDEVKSLYATDLSSEPELEIQRDIFVFQCHVGCRIGDLIHFKKTDIIDNVLYFIPSKTIKENARTVSVPLNSTARAIVDKYKESEGDRLLPFSRPQDYNDAIKEAFRRAGITRLVVILDPLTRLEKKVPIDTIASSHMARRTFVGNIYKQVRDPNLVASLTGHVEGSRAFSRYRAIDNDIKKELVTLLE